MVVNTINGGGVASSGLLVTAGGPANNLSQSSAATQGSGVLQSALPVASIPQAPYYDSNQVMPPSAMLATQATLYSASPRPYDFPERLVFKNFATASVGLHPKEVHDLQGCFDTMKVIDLEASGLREVDGWLCKLQERLTRGVETFGDFYPEYRVYFVLDETVNACVYKFREPAQKFYRGHVFINVGLLREMMKNAGGTWSIEEVEETIAGVQGVLAHEVAHPKEDELVRWETQASHDGFANFFNQMDEICADIIAQRVLKAADLSADNMLTGLKLVFGEKADLGERVQRSAEAVLSTHPENRVREGLNRASLVYLRMEEGKYEVKKIDYDAQRMRYELSCMVGALESKFHAIRVKEQAKENGISAIVACMDEITLELKKMSENRRGSRADTYKKYVELVSVLNEVYVEGGSLSADDEKKLIEFLEYILTFGEANFSSGLWTRGGFGSSGENPFGYNPEHVRRAQKLYDKLALFKDGAVEKWLDGKLGEGFWRFVRSDYVGSFHLLTLILPRDMVRKVYERALSGNDLEEIPLKKQALFIMEMINGCILMGGETDDLEIRLIDSIRTFYKKGYGDGGAEAYREAYLEALADLENVLYLDDEKDEYIKDRFLLTDDRRRALVEAWGGLFKEMILRPDIVIKNKTLLAMVFNQYKTYFSEAKPFFWTMINASLNPDDPPRDFVANNPVDSQKIFEFMMETFQSEPWQNTFRGIFQSGNPHSGSVSVNYDSEWTAVRLFSASRNGLAFTPQQNRAISEVIFSAAADASPDSKMFSGRIIGEVVALDRIPSMDSTALRHSVVRVASLVRQKTGKDLFEYLEGLLESRKIVVTKTFLGGYKLVTVIEILRDNLLISEKRYHELIEQYVFHAFSGESNTRRALDNANRHAAYAVWKRFRSGKYPQGPVEFLEKIRDLYRFDASLIPHQEERAMADAGVSVDPSYSRYYATIADGLADDFVKIIGKGDAGVSFNANYDSIIRFLSLIFQPEGRPIEARFRKIVDYSRLEYVASKLMPLVPAESLDLGRRFEIWSVMASSRTHNKLDDFFETHIYADLKAMPGERRREVYRYILDHALLRSERLTSELVSDVISPLLDELKQFAPDISDARLIPVIRLVANCLPQSSRFRDEVIENIAWELELNESLLYKYVEPMRSSNFRTIHPSAMNLLPPPSVTLEKISVKEKLQLIDYFKNPAKPLRTVLPWIDGFSEELNRQMERRGFNGVSFIDTLETFIRDAGDNERLVMNELIIGSRGTGLWYMSEEVREQLFEKAGMPKGSVERKLFDAYLGAIPKYEHSITLSYLITTYGQYAGSQLLRIMEMFDAPGIKFAQMSSVLGIFGPERSAELAEAKDRALPTTRTKVIELLKKNLPPEEFAKIRRIHRKLGSGSVKYVVLVEYVDGSREAVSIRRPFLEKRIESTLDILKEWARNLKAYPELVEDYDFDYYLESLRSQLADEIGFDREFQSAAEIAPLYSSARSHKGWSFEPLPPSKGRVHNENILQFRAVEDAVPFGELSAKDREAVGELILVTELDLMLHRNIFDADRHLGNYLFDPQRKKVYAIDIGQKYALQPNGLVSAGDSYNIARLIRGFTMRDTSLGANVLADVFLDIAEAVPSGGNELRYALVGRLSDALTKDADMRGRVFRALAALNNLRIRIPLRFSMGVIKGLTILLSEDYAKAVSPKFIEDRIRPFVEAQLVFGGRFALFGKASSLARRSGSGIVPRIP